MKNKIILYPFLISLFPVISMYAHNKDMVQPSYLIRPLIIVILATVFIFFILTRLKINSRKASLLTSLYTITFLSFGHYLPAVPNIVIHGLIIKNYFLLIVIYLILLIAASAITITSKRTFRALTSFLNKISIILILIPIITLATYGSQVKNQTKTKQEVAQNNYTETETRPDIYYIILDGYARFDILKEIYEYDNSNFIDFLSNTGFYVAASSSANYAQTYQSISSSLNYEYINYLAETEGIQSQDRRLYKELINNNNLYRFLKEKDYTFVTLPSPWSGTNKNLPSDIFLEYKMNINEFDKILLNNTPLGLFIGKQWLLNFHRNRARFVYDKIGDIAEYKEPTFTYVHILSPHPPFIFDAKGEAVNPNGIAAGLDGSHYFEHYPDKEEYKNKYRNQLAFVSKKITETIREILEKSEQPPIIILQSDHGPGSRCDWENPDKTYMPERFSILNAYYLPLKAKNTLYSSITPVNTFRIVLNSVFEAGLPLLPDRSYFTTWTKPYNFIEVTNKLTNVKELTNPN
ncbi:LTA synthase family protein [bacterium]|nr:LTA synthase family protein [bacterium]